MAEAGGPHGEPFPLGVIDRDDQQQEGGEECPCGDGDAVTSAPVGEHEDERHCRREEDGRGGHAEAETDAGEVEIDPAIRFGGLD